MAYTTLTPRDHARPYVAGDPWRAGQEAERVADNLDDHEARIVAVEAAGLLRVTVPLTDAQIKALPTSGFTIVAAPGSGFRIEPLHVAITVNTSAGAYTNIHANAYLHVHTSDWNNDWFDYLVNGNATSVTEVTGFLGGAARKRWRPKPAIYPGTAKLTAAYGGLAMVETATSSDNAPLILYMSNTGGNLTGGNAANSMTIECLYQAVPVY